MLLHFCRASAQMSECLALTSRQLTSVLGFLSSLSLSRSLSFPLTFFMLILLLFVHDYAGRDSLERETERPGCFGHSMQEGGDDASRHQLLPVLRARAFIDDPEASSRGS